MFGLGPTELLLIVLVLLILFGGRKIPELMRGLGAGIREFKRAASLDEESPRPTQEPLRSSSSEASPNRPSASQP
jgi:sec-independent protein translocase protein TatA